MTGPLRLPASRSVSWTHRALADLEGIHDYIARDNPAAASKWVSRILATAGKVAMAPFAGRRVPEIGRDDVREVFLRTYRIVYRVNGKRCEILTVFEGHRRFPGDVAAPCDAD